ncbi:hypothetical protein OSB04_031735 [Centaurea solstitialis]|uniref:Reverse transcriptase domain-containing protein n=2 Tax=Magnoliopsida TaxID=3398 RepID=A0AA38VUM7_9ASTR|nr:hypothetical protein OSB04_031735 [Centaurea solstitialis]
MSSSAAFSPDHHHHHLSPPPPPTEQLCYVQCEFCDTVLAVSVPCSSLFTTVTVRCGHCTNLLSVNMRALLLPAANAAANQLHLPHNFFSHQNIIMEEMRNTPSNLFINQPNPNASFPPVRVEELPKPPVANRPPEKRQRVPSAYNRFIKEEIQRIKAGNPDISHREAFSAAAKNEGEDLLMKDGFLTTANVDLKKYWDQINDDVFGAVKYFESHPVINPGSNASFITLVPKVRDPLNLSEFRPINLIGCVTKIISKVLAERLKTVVNPVISKSKTAFIKGRSILDGPLVINEILDWAKRSKNQMLIFKIDFEKAFDSLNWGFLDDILAQMGFGDRWRAWVRGCITTTRVSILVNGSPTKEFRMEKGVRQGDPLAPFLFILAMEGLYVAMKEAKLKCIFKGIHLDNVREEISILLYADDAIFLGDWTRRNVTNLIRILQCFHICSGLKINFLKSKLIGVNVHLEETKRMARRLNCKTGTLPFNYLGIPASTLSIGGRLCLFKSVLGSLGNYYFSLYKAPMKVINALESIRCKFFWGGNEEKKKICWIAWKEVINDKRNGGLGIGSLRALNLALLGKWWGRFFSESHSTWKDIIISRHGNLGGLLDPIRNSGAAGNWRMIVGARKDLEKVGIQLERLWQQVPSTSLWRWKLEENAKEIGANLKIWWKDWPINSDSMVEFWTTIQNVSHKTGVKKVGEVIGLAYLWVLWNQRNEMIYNKRMMTVKQMVNSIQFQAFSWLKARSVFGNGINWEEWVTAPIKSTCISNFLAPR